jgi:hypothetical protein
VQVPHSFFTERKPSLVFSPSLQASFAALSCVASGQPAPSLAHSRSVSRFLRDTLLGERTLRNHIKKTFETIFGLIYQLWDTAIDSNWEK